MSVVGTADLVCNVCNTYQGVKGVKNFMQVGFGKVYVYISLFFLNYILMKFELYFIDLLKEITYLLLFLGIVFSSDFTSIKYSYT